MYTSHHITYHIIIISIIIIIIIVIIIIIIIIISYYTIHVHINYCERRGLGVWQSRQFSQQEDMFCFLRKLELGENPRYVKEGNKG